MKNMTRITIQKNKQNYHFYMDDKKTLLRDIVPRLKREKVSMCHIQTFEDEVKLVDCYIPFQSETQFKRQLIKAAKAKA